MFQKQTFGSTNTGFGSLNTSTTSPFGGFKLNTGTSAFGAPPAFGANATPQPATGGGLFGSPNTSGGLFGTNPTTSTFGQSSGFGFGASTSSGGLFNNSSGGGLFGNNQNTSAFGAKPATGFGFGGTASTATTGGLFGTAPSTSTGLFGQQNNTISSGGLFGGTTGGFGQTQATGTAHVKYNPVVGTDVVVKSGTSQNVNIKHHCITCMKEYEGKSLEELRLEDYVAGRKGQTSGGMFGFQQPAENKPLFGGGTFGQPATTSAPSLFGGSIGSTPAFGQTNTFSFGSNTQSNTNTTGLFGASKPAFGTTSTTGTGLFGATTTQAPTFGSTNTFGFGANTQNQSCNISYNVVFESGCTWNFGKDLENPETFKFLENKTLPKEKVFRENHFRFQEQQPMMWQTVGPERPFQPKKLPENFKYVSKMFDQNKWDRENAKIRKDKLILDAATAKAAIDAQLEKDLAEIDKNVVPIVHVKNCTWCNVKEKMD